MTRHELERQRARDRAADGIATREEVVARRNGIACWAPAENLSSTERVRRSRARRAAGLPPLRPYRSRKAATS